MRIPPLDDARSAFRRLSRQPAFALGVVLTLGLALGANTAIFSVVHRLLLSELPFAEPERLVVVHARETGSDVQPFSIPDFLDLREAATRFEGLSAWGSWSVNLTGIEQPIRLTGQLATAGFFRLLGARAALGRLPSPEEERPGAPRVVLLSDVLFRTQLGGDASVLGRPLTLNGEPYTVIGVLPPEFVFFSPGAQLVAPLAVEADSRRSKRGAAFLRVLGRLKPGVKAGAAAAELDAAVARLRADFPATNAGRLGVRVEPLSERIVGTYRKTLLCLQASVVAVLLIACANLASLFLARADGRRRELAVRSALGASRGELRRQLLAESLLLSLAGGLLAFLLALAGARTLVALAPSQLPRAAEVRVGAAEALFALALSLGAGLLLGALPAARAGRTNPADELRGGVRGTPGRHAGLARALLVLLEVALALVLLVCGGLLTKSLRRLREVDPGYRPDHLLTAQLSLPRSRYGKPADIDTFRLELIRRLAALPGVERVDAASLNPLTAWRATVRYVIDGRAEPSRDRAPMANYRAVGPGYLPALGVPQLSGRALDERDRDGAPPVALISATLAHRHFPGGNVLGSRLLVDDSEPWRAVEVVGVVGDVKHTGLDAEDTADVYVPYAQAPQGVAVYLANIFCVALRTTVEPALLVPATRREISATDRDVATTVVRPMEDALEESLAGRRFTTRLLELFGTLALLLAFAGVYAVTSMGVAERRRELGIRLSLGASPGRVLALVVRGALHPVGAGILVGGAAAVPLGRLLSGLLFGVGPRDPGAFVAAAFLLALAAAAASLLPALRAARIDPAVTLVTE